LLPCEQNDILHFDQDILQIPENFSVYWFVINIDKAIDCLIMKRVIKRICLMRCKGSAQKNYFKKRRPYELTKLAAILCIMGLHHIPLSAKSIERSMNMYDAANSKS
jgi:hypothetical protein